MRWLVPVLALSACRPSGPGVQDGPDAATDDDAGADAGPSYPPPRDDLVPAVGTDGAIDIATWNLENFPKQPSTPALVADLIASLDLDLVALQEIEDVAAFDELVARLPDHDGVLSTDTYGDGTYQKLGFVYRRGLLTASEGRLLLTEHGYELPRPPLEIAVATAGGVDFTVIAVHLKAGFGGEDRARREQAVVLLEQHVAAGGDPDAIVLGDLNEVLTTDAGRAVFEPWLEPPDAYDVHTEALAGSGGVSFLPSGVILDHVITTAALRDELAGGGAVIPRLDMQVPGYEQGVSDHLPVVVSMPVR